MKSHRAQNIVGLIIGSLLLCFAAFYNGYPLVYPDTGTYLHSGFRGDVPLDRPIIYGLLVRHSSLSTTLWFVVITQGMLLGSMIYAFIRYLLPSRRQGLLFMGMVTLLVLFSGISTRASQIMPDIFAPMPALGLSILLFGQKVPTWVRVYVSFLVVISLMMHSSHPLIYTLLWIVLSVIWGIYWFRTKQLPVSLRNWVLSLALLLVAWVGIPSVHVLFGGPFKANQSSHVFLMGQLHQMGLLKHYLDRHCEGEDSYVLCPYKDELPFDYLWDQSSPIYKMGGWAQQDPEAYGKLSGDLLSTPRYFKWFFIKVIFGTFHQFFHFHTDNTPPQRSDSPAYQAIQIYFPYEIFPLVLARQWIAERLTYDALNVRERMLVFLCLLGVVALLLQPSWVQRVPPELIWTLVLIMAMLLVNSAVCGGLSNGNMRYQNRVVWALPLTMGLILLSQRQRLYDLWATWRQR